MTTSLRVAINAQIVPGGGAGGVETVLVGLIKSLGSLDGPEEFVIIGPSQDPDWLAPYLGSNERFVRGPTPRLRWLKGLLGPLRPAARMVRGRMVAMRGRGVPGASVSMSDGFYERLGCEVIHFPYQEFVISGLPAVYNPHDLQHLHYPEFFSPEILAWRAGTYPAGCRLAHTVAVASAWVKEDVVRHYGVDPQKVQVIPWAPPTQAYPDPSPEVLDRVRGRYSLMEPFALYPSMTWPHKNHIRLLEALARLRDREHLRVRLVCTGFLNEFWPRIERRLDELRLRDQVVFVGMVPGEDLRALYRLSQFVVIPTLFEAASGPLFEAWHDGAPVACSNVTSLPDQAGDAALIFDPLAVEAIAAAVGEMTTNPDLRESLRQRGTRRLADFSWDRSARAYRAVYRRAAGLPLSEEDQWLLSWDWMRDRKAIAAPVEPAR